MPHVIIEYTEDCVDNQRLANVLEAAYRAVVETQLFREENIKVRAIGIKHYRLGLGATGFIHVQCRIHQGRSEAQKQQLSSRVVEGLRGLSLELQFITCEVVEMDRRSYSKYSRAS